MSVRTIDLTACHIHIIDLERFDHVLKLMRRIQPIRGECYDKKAGMGIFKNFNEAIVSYRESVFYAKKAGMTKTLTDAYRALYTTYLKTDQQDSSALYLKKFNAMLDTLEKYNQKATIVDSNFNLYVQNAKSFAKKAKLLDEHSAKSFKLMIFFISFALLSALLYWLLHFIRFQKRK